MNNKFNQAVSVLALSVVTPLAFASSHVGFFKPYIGAEVIQTNQQYKTGFGDNLFTENPQNYNFFAGFNFWKALGLEAGYEFQPRRSKSNLSFGAGSVIAGGTAVGATVIDSYIENQDPYLGIFADTDVKAGSGKWNFKGLVGFSVTTVKANYTIINNLGAPVNAPRDFKKTKVVPMVKLTSSYIFSNNVGVRLSLNYRDMAAFDINAQQVPARQIQLKNMFGIGLGLTYSFR